MAHLAEGNVAIHLCLSTHYLLNPGAPPTGSFLHGPCQSEANHRATQQACPNLLSKIESLGVALADSKSHDPPYPGGRQHAVRPTYPMGSWIASG